MFTRYIETETSSRGLAPTTAIRMAMGTSMATAIATGRIQFVSIRVYPWLMSTPKTEHFGTKTPGGPKSTLANQQLPIIKTERPFRSERKPMNNFFDLLPSVNSVASESSISETPGGDKLLEVLEQFKLQAEHPQSMADHSPNIFLKAAMNIAAMDMFTVLNRFDRHLRRCLRNIRSPGRGLRAVTLSPLTPARMGRR